MRTITRFMKTEFYILAAISALGFANLEADAANFVVNGGFENNIYGGSGLPAYSPPAGSSSINNWSWSESAAPYPTAVELLNQDVNVGAIGGKAANNGTNAVSLEGATSWISQTVTLPAGQYRLSLSASRWLGALAVNPICASLGGVNFSFNGSTNAFSPTDGYTPYISDVFTVATNGTYELKIAANNPAGGLSGGTAVDDVTLEPDSLVINGGFEANTYVAPIPSGYAFGPYSPTLGSSSIAKWSWSETVAPYPTAVRLLNQNFDFNGTIGGLAAHGGDYAVSLEGATSWISQNVTLPAGQYRLSFGASRWLGAVAVNPIYASLGGVNVSFNGSTNAFSPTDGYTYYGSDVFTVATNGTYELKIAANNPAGGYSGGTAVDDVRIYAEKPDSLVSNGSFELNHYVAPIPGGDQFGPYSPTLGSSSITNWTWSETVWPYPTAARILNQFVDGSGASGELAADDGDFAVSLEGESWVSQNVTLAAGQYQLSFAASFWLTNYLPVNPIYASLDGVNFSFSGSTNAFSPTNGWTTYTSDVFTVGTAGTYALTIAATGPYPLGTAVDNVRLNAAAPEAQVSVALTNGNVVVSWSGSSLQWSTNLTAWTQLTNAPQPYVEGPTNAARFFRAVK